MKTKPTTLERFSDLPDLVAHHILSFLTFTDLIRFGTTSKKCRELYLSAPSLNFEVSRPSFRRSTTKTTQFFNSVERFLLHRGNNAIILRFRICWVFNQRARMVDEQLFRVASWIQNAVRGNVQDIELDLTLNNYETFPLPKTFKLAPSCIWNSTSLRSLVVASRYMIFQVPSFSLSCNLYSLTLRCVKIEDENFGKWISCCCKSIKQLWLEESYGQLKNLTIKSSSLRSLTLFHVFVRSCHLKCEKLEYLCVDHFDIIASMNIFAPNLKHFSWSGKLNAHRIIGDLMSLEKVELSLRSHQVDDFDNIMELLSCIRRTKVLIVDWITVKAVFKEGSVPLLLDEIRELGMHIFSLDDDLVPAMVSFLRGMTNLNTLWIKSAMLSSNVLSKDDPSGFSMDFWKSQRLAFVSQLKEVRMELSNGSNNEIELARYILEHAHHLQNMVILYMPQQSRTLKTIRTKIASIAKMVLKKRKI